MGNGLTGESFGAVVGTGLTGDAFGVVGELVESFLFLSGLNRVPVTTCLSFCLESIYLCKPMVKIIRNTPINRKTEGVM